MLTLTKLRAKLEEKRLSPEQVAVLANGNKRRKVISNMTIRRAASGIGVKQSSADEIARALRLTVDDLL